MAFLLVKHSIKDFNQWKNVYESMSEARHQHGAIGTRIMQGAENPKQVVVLEEYQTLEGAQTWVQSSELRLAMGHAGVNGIPEITFLENIS